MTGSPITVLLVDDEPGVLNAVRLLLQALGFQVHPFSEPLKALEFAKTGVSLDVCLSDLRMPVMTGLELLKALHDARPALPFILMSAHALDADLEEAQKLGARGVLPKPFTPDGLREAIQKALLPNS